jgi:hypothetical protein
MFKVGEKSEAVTADREGSRGRFARSSSASDLLVITSISEPDHGVHLSQALPGYAGLSSSDALSVLAK